MPNQSSMRLMPNKPRVAVTQSTLNAESNMLELLHLPLIKIQPLTFNEDILKKKYDWLVLTSKNAVDILMKHRDKINVDYIASIGEKTSERIRSYGLEIDFEPESYTQEGFIERFDTNGHLEVLYPASKNARSFLKESLESHGISVQKIDLYEPVPDEESINRLKVLFHEIDVVTVSSPSAAHILHKYFTADMLNGKLITAVGPVTAAALDSCGIKSVLPEKETLTHMINLIEEKYRGAFDEF